MKRKKRARSQKKGIRNRKSTRKTPPKNLSVKVLKLFFEKPNKNFTSKELQNIIGVKNHSEKAEIVNILRQLHSNNKIQRTNTGGFCLNRDIKTTEAKIVKIARRVIFAESENFTEDIKISSDNNVHLLEGDLVKLMVFPQSREGNNPEGEIVEVIERGKSQIVGTIQDAGGIYFLIPDSKSISFDVFIHGKHLKGAKNGDKVIAQVYDWGEEQGKKNPEGKVVDVLGKPGENDVEMHAILAEFDLPYKFPKVVEKDAASISEKISSAEIKKRRDFRNVTTFTIDPHDAKDLDDALSIQKLENGNWEVGVHIADVTHYIQTNSSLEQEAQERATSVYLVDRVVPMLPEKLSNRLCSLNPNEDKLTFSAVFELDDEAHIKSQWFGRTIINCNKRFAYEEAQGALEGKEFPLSDEIIQLNKLALKLREERFKNGSISFETVELKFNLAEDGTPLSVYVKERKDAHKLIEDFMLLANKIVAEFIFNKKKGERNTMIYRVHEPPDPEKMKSLKDFAKKFGYNVSIDGDISKSLNQLAEDTEGKTESSVLQNFAIRSMSKAKYTTDALGHFGLGFNHYSHFTSPIRRYPDMICHRMLQHYLDGGKSLDANEYENLCKHSSNMEKKASDAERASIKYKQVEYMQDAVGKTFNGVVSGVTDWGIFVEIEGTGCEGMVRMTDLKDDFYSFDEKQFAVIGQRSRKKITLGDVVKVKIKEANLHARTIDLKLVSTDY